MRYTKMTVLSLSMSIIQATSKGIADVVVRAGGYGGKHLSPARTFVNEG